LPVIATVDLSLEKRKRLDEWGDKLTIVVKNKRFAQLPRRAEETFVLRHKKLFRLIEKRCG
jgi:hypothetical protein